MTDKQQQIILIDLPTFPKGVISLSLLSVASCLKEVFNVKIIDLNIVSFQKFQVSEKGVLMYGLKVSSQNLLQAISLTNKLRSHDSFAKIVWGGELPSLLPDLCLEHADTVVGGLFEPIASTFIQDLRTNVLQKKYFGNNNLTTFSKPDFGQLPQLEKYYSFMGYPLETSRGCTENCFFCMKHIMQKKNYNLGNKNEITSSLSQYKGKFINVVDYNFGVDAKYVIEIADLIKKSGAIGWMAEMCIELLDRNDVLEALKNSRCKMIYCGLESIDQQSLKSVHKLNTNHIDNYERIIRKVQSYDIQIAAGIILGLDGTHQNTFKELFDFYQRMGIIYAKLTFLTYNPGTRVHEYVKKYGKYLNEEISSYDGNRLTYLPNGVDAGYVAKGTEEFILKYYSLKGIVARSFNTQLTLLGKLEFILFNLCYRKVYFSWLEYEILTKPENMIQLIEMPFIKSQSIIFTEKVLQWVRELRQ